MDTGHSTRPLFKSMRKGMRRRGVLGVRADNATAHGVFWQRGLGSKLRMVEGASQSDMSGTAYL